MEQFIYALTPRGYVLTKSAGVDNHLRQDTIRCLCKLQKSDDQYWPTDGTEGCITISTVTQTSDQYQRLGVKNHTLIIPLLEYLAYTQPRRMVESHVWNGEDVPGVLKAKKLE